MLKRLLPPTGVAASFEDDSMRVGVVKLADARTVALFNWKDEPQTLPALCLRLATSSPIIGRANILAGMKLFSR